MSDDRRKRTHSPIAVSPVEVGKIAARVNELGYRDEALFDRVSKVEHAVNSLRIETSHLSDGVRDMSTTKKLAMWGLGILVPLVLVGAVSVILSVGRQESLERSKETAEQKMIRVESRIGAIEYDTSAIKTEQQHTRRVLERVSDSLDELNKGQARLEESVRRRH